MQNLLALGINPLLVFWGGIISFFSPCVFPLLPIFISNLAGDNGDTKGKYNYRVLINTIGFVIGISTVYLLLGLSATFIGRTLFNYRNIITKIGGGLAIIFGLHQIGIFNLKILNNNLKINYGKYKPTFFKSYLLGLTFSFGWTPCISVFLTPVLFIIGTDENFVRGMTLLVIYIVGFALPFILFALLFMFGKQYLKLKEKHYKILKVISGIFLIIMGILLYNNYLNILTFTQ